MELPNAVDCCAVAARLARKSDMRKNFQMARQITMTGATMTRVAARLRLIRDSPATTGAPDKPGLRLPFTAIPILTVITAVAVGSSSVSY